MRGTLGYGLSLGLFMAGRGLLRAALSCKLWREAKSGRRPTWQGYGELLSQRPLFFHYVMFQAPRWNDHAVIGVLPAFRVERAIHIDIAAVRRSAATWTVVVYAKASGPRTVAAIGPEQDTDAEGRVRLDLPPGAYHLGVRYYGCREHAVWPALWIDDQAAIAARPLGQEALIYQRYLDSLRGRCPLFYQWVHHHLFVALAQGDVSAPVLDRLVLPVGNPETVFRYGLLPSGLSLRVRQDPALQAQGLVFLTVLNRASLPLYGCQVVEAVFDAPRFAEPVLYLVRIQPWAGSALPPTALSVEIIG